MPGEGGTACGGWAQVGLPVSHTYKNQTPRHSHYTHSVLLLPHMVTLETLFDTGSGSPAQNRNTDWPDVVRMVEPSRTRRGQTNSASHRLFP